MSLATRQVDCDVLIIGGGCNGSGLARDLALRGVRVVLCDKGDLGRGATGASSAMIHGGPRYLLYDVATTRHSCTDSGYIQRIAPHILFRIPFLLPVWRQNPYGRFGLLLHDVYFDVYDRYTPLKNGLPHACVSAAQLRALEPGLQGDFLGGVSFDEWGIDAGRLCVFNARDAQAHGAQIYTYHEVAALRRDPQGKLLGAHVRVVDGEGDSLRVTAPVVVNCAGAWAANLTTQLLASQPLQTTRLRPGKGIHLIYEKRCSNFALATHAIDGRQIFVMPYQNETWVGTTDDDFYGDYDDVRANHDEVAYLQEAASRLLPQLAAQRLINTRGGVRNTLYAWGLSEDDLSRGYRLVDHATPPGAARGSDAAAQAVDGFYTLLGGKLASYRAQAEVAADAICQRLGVAARCQTHQHTLPGGSPPYSGAALELELAQQYAVSPLSVRRLLGRHGSLTPDVLALSRETASGAQVVDAAEPTLECEIRYCIRHEYVRRLGDLMLRCRVAMGADMGLQSATRTAQIFAEERGLSAVDERAARADLLTRRWASAQAVLRGAQLAQVEALRLQYV